MTHNPEVSWQEEFRRFAAVLRDAGVVAEEPTSFATRPQERLIQAIWHDQMFRTDEATTASGKAIEVLEPGRWNTGPGPDFLDARLRIAGEELAGAIEIHVDSSDWHHHGHDRDFTYNAVILHVVLRGGDDRPYDERQNGSRLERFVLEHALESDLETIRATINPADYPFPEDEAKNGLCHRELVKLPADQLDGFLLAAGKARIEAKVARLAAQSRTASAEQLLWQSLLTSLGIRQSKTLYFLLSRRAPIDELLSVAKDYAPGDRADVLLAVLLNVAQLLPPLDLAGEDEETRAFRARLDRFWKPLRPYYADRLIPPTKRWFSGVRPAGFPARRLTAAAMLAARGFEGETALLPQAQARIDEVTPAQLDGRGAGSFRKRLLEPFLVDGRGHYFTTHFTFGGKKQTTASVLLGESGCESLLFNVVVPLVLLRARAEKNPALERRCWEVLSTWPALEKNGTVRFMARRLFGTTGREKAYLRREVYQQSLLKVFSDCCAMNERSCSECTLLAFEREVSSRR